MEFFNVDTAIGAIVGYLFGVVGGYLTRVHGERRRAAAQDRHD